MTQSFDEWKEEQERIHNDYDAENAWYAGAQSRQAEIDEYKEVASSMEDAYIREKAKVGELQKRIDDALKYIGNGCSGSLDPITKLNIILKGESNE